MSNSKGIKVSKKKDPKGGINITATCTVCGGPITHSNGVCFVIRNVA
jgi:hypothetical protein